MISYNQEAYIAQAIEGILMQRIGYPIQIYIGEDCSTDSTRDICIEYKNKYPDKITLLLPEKNQGVSCNFSTTLIACDAEYIAICEGDDYWTDPYKLQTQVDFLEANPDYSLVYHKVNELFHESNIIKPEILNLSNEELTYTGLDLAKRNFIHTPSVMIRNNGLDFTKLKQLSTVSDYYLWMLCTQKGKIKYLPQIMAVYRVSENSTWALKAENLKVSYWLIMLSQLLREFTNDGDVYSELFFQLKLYFKGFYNRCKNNNEDRLLDKTTKELLMKSSDFQLWWFIYMLHIKARRLYRLKYYFYLLKKRSLNSVWLIKKCLY